MSKQLPWKKVLTREYTFLFASYMVSAYKIMKNLVGTTLEYNLLYGQRNLLTVYRIEEDIQNSYKLIEKIVKQYPSGIVKKMDDYDILVQHNYELYKAIENSKDKLEIRRLLIELDKTFLQTLCHYLFFVYMGYAGDLEEVKKFIKKHYKRFSKIRNYKIDIDMNKKFPMLFGKYDNKLNKLTPYLSRIDLKAALDNRELDLEKINKRKKQYLMIIKKQKSNEVSFDQIDTELEKEIKHLKIKFSQTTVKGRIACMGKVIGKARIVLTQSDYDKLTEGDILIIPMTKPDIVPYLSKVGGVVTNDGGALSHASIIAREMNIPCIVGTTIATDIFKDDDTILLDANAGEVKKIK